MSALAELYRSRAAAKTSEAASLTQAALNHLNSGDPAEAVEPLTDAEAAARAARRLIRYAEQEEAQTP